MPEQLELPLSTGVEVVEFRLQRQVDEVIPLAKRCADEIPIAGVNFDELMLRVSLGQLLRNETRNYQNLFLAYNNGKLVGFLLASIGHAWYAERTVAHEELWYVTPSSRGTASLALLARFEAWARQCGAVIALTGSINELSAEKTSQLLTKLGYRHIGVTHVKEF